MVFNGVTNAQGPSASQQHTGYQHAALQPQQEVTKPNLRQSSFAQENWG